MVNNNLNMDKPREYCGVVGIYGSPDASILSYLGMYSLQHRGQEAAGIVSYTPLTGFNTVRRIGQVRDNFTKPDVMNSLPGLMLEGMAIAGLAVGATEGWIYLRSEYPDAGEVLTEAIERARAAGCPRGRTTARLRRARPGAAELGLAGGLLLGGCLLRVPFAESAS